MKKNRIRDFSFLNLFRAACTKLALSLTHRRYESIMFPRKVYDESTFLHKYVDFLQRYLT